MFIKILITILIKKNKILKAFDDMIADMINNKKLKSIVTELFITGGKLNISLVFITQSSKGCQTKHHSLFCYDNYK